MTGAVAAGPVHAAGVQRFPYDQTRLLLHAYARQGATVGCAHSLAPGYGARLSVAGCAGRRGRSALAGATGPSTLRCLDRSVAAAGRRPSLPAAAAPGGVAASHGWRLRAGTA